MKSIFWISTVTAIIIASILGSIFYFNSTPESTQPDPSDDTPNSGIQLVVDNLSALPDGQVSFKVSFNDDDSSVIEAVVINGERYSWLDGSQEDPTISKNETKEWSVDIGECEQNENIQVVVEATAGSASANTTVGATAPDGITPAIPIVNPQTPDNQTLPDYVYDYYGGVNLFSEGIHVLATSQDPRTLFGEFNVANDYWKMLLDSEITQATDQDFISILLSRGNKPTGGYDIQIENFAWFESYPVKFLFQVNFTDPGEGVMVTEALTNPLVLVPIGKLTSGQYNIEVPIAQYILNIDEEGNPYYRQILTFAPVIWEQTLTINKTEEPTPSTTFEVILNGNEAPDLTIQVDLTNGLTEDEAKNIVEAAFVRTLEGKLHRLDSITYDNQQIVAHYTWGYDENDMGHIFDITAEITKLEITIVHCR